MLIVRSVACKVNKLNSYVPYNRFKKYDMKLRFSFLSHSSIRGLDLRVGNQHNWRKMIIFAVQILRNEINKHYGK